MDKESRTVKWNEPVTLFLKRKVFDESAVLCIDFFATQNHGSIADMLDMAHAAGEDAGDEENAEERQTKTDRLYRQIQEFEQRVLAIDATVKDRQDQLQAFRFSDHKRRWNQLLESRKRMVKYFNVALPVPPVPPTHFPCGSLRLRFSRLRPILRPPGKLVEFTRTPRFTDKGQIRFDVDFIPLFFNSDPRKNDILVPPVPSEADLPPIIAPDHLFEPIEATERKLGGLFATRAEKLNKQSRDHYVRWWNSLSGEIGKKPKSDTSKPKTFKEQEIKLARTVAIIARSMVV
jgi:hypothetical protein